MDADQQADGLDAQPLQPHRPDQRLHRLEHLGREVRGLSAGASRDSIQSHRQGGSTGTCSGSVEADPRF